MKYFYYTFLAIALTSCKNNDAEAAQPDPRTIVPFTQQAATDLETQSTQTEVAKGHNLFQENNPTSTQSVVAGINPAHGQPNHRCDIEVGAPLSSPIKNASTTTQTNIQPTPITTSTTSVSDPVKNAATNNSNIPALLATDTPEVITPEGMNPPHGKPGHDCGIAVGDPLSKK